MKPTSRWACQLGGGRWGMPGGTRCRSKALRETPAKADGQIPSRDRKEASSVKVAFRAALAGQRPPAGACQRRAASLRARLGTRAPLLFGRCGLVDHEADFAPGPVNWAGGRWGMPGGTRCRSKALRETPAKAEGQIPSRARKEASSVKVAFRAALAGQRPPAGACQRRAASSRARLGTRAPLLFGRCGLVDHEADFELRPVNWAGGGGGCLAESHAEVKHCGIRPRKAEGQIPSRARKEASSVKVAFRAAPAGQRSPAGACQRRAASSRARLGTRAPLLFGRCGFADHEADFALGLSIGRGGGGGCLAVRDAEAKHCGKRPRRQKARFRAATVRKRLPSRSHSEPRSRGSVLLWERAGGRAASSRARLGTRAPLLFGRCGFVDHEADFAPGPVNWAGAVGDAWRYAMPTQSTAGNAAKAEGQIPSRAREEASSVKVPFRAAPAGQRPPAGACQRRAASLRARLGTRAPLLFGRCGPGDS